MARTLLLWQNKQVQMATVKNYCAVNLCLVTIKYKNPSWTNKTVPQKYVFDFKV